MTPSLSLPTTRKVSLCYPNTHSAISVARLLNKKQPSFSKSAQEIVTAVVVKSEKFQNVTNRYLGYFCKKLCHKIFQKQAQSGHTFSHRHAYTLSLSLQPTHKGSYIFKYVDVKAFSTRYIYYLAYTVPPPRIEQSVSGKTGQLFGQKKNNRDVAIFCYLPIMNQLTFIGGIRKKSNLRQIGEILCFHCRPPPLLFLGLVMLEQLFYAAHNYNR